MGGAATAMVLSLYMVSDEQPPQSSTSVACTDLRLMKDQGSAEPPYTYDAVVHWSQRLGAMADLMQLLFNNGTSTKYFPLSGVTGQEQVLQLGPTTGSSANVAATIYDTDGNSASCPPAPVTIP